MSLTPRVVTAWFPDDDGHAALESATTLQEALRTYRSRAFGPELGARPMVRIALAAGRGHRWLLGRPDEHVIEVFGGELWDRVRSALDAAGLGDVLVGSEVVANVGDRLTVSGLAGEDQADPFARLGAYQTEGSQSAGSTAPHLSENLVRPWLLPHVYESAVRGHTAFLASEMPVTTVSVAFLLAGGVGAQQARAGLDTLVREVQSVLARTGGLLTEVLMGTEQGTLSLVFGATPPHGDHILRALTAAWGIRGVCEDLHDITFVSAGVASGDVRAGVFGGQHRRQFGVAGQPVVRAEELMYGASDERIICDESVVAKGAVAYRFDLPDPSGAAELLSVEAVDQISTQPARSGFVNRAGNGTVLDQLTSAAAGRRHGVVVVEGESGMGKSRWLDELASRAQAERILVFRVNGSAVLRPPGSRSDDLIAEGEPASYYAWASVIRELFADTGGMDDPRLELVSHFLNGSAVETEYTRGLSAEARAANLRALVVEALAQRIDDVPCVILVDDAQWMDSGSWALALDIAQSRLPLLSVVAMPPPIEMHADAGVWQLMARTLTEIPDAQRIELTPLASETAVELIRDRLDSDDVPEELRSWLVKESAGNPFYLEELVQDLQERELVHVTGGVVEVDNDFHAIIERLPTTSRDVPESIQLTVLDRVARQSERAQAVLKTASVVGPRFDTRIVQEIYPIDRDRHLVPAALESLARSGMIRPGRANGQTYEFKHNLVQQVVHSRMDARTTSTLHLAAANWMESEGAGSDHAQLAAIAQHFELGGDADRAVMFWNEVAEDALASFANTEADAVYARMLALGADPQGMKADWQIKHGEALANLACYGAARTELERGLETAGRLIPSQGYRLIARSLGLMVRRAVSRIIPYRLAPEEQRPTFVRDALGFEKLVEVYFFNDKLVHALYAALKTLSLAEHSGSDPVLARALATAGAIFGFIPLHGRAQVYMRKAAELVEVAEDAKSETYVSLVEAFYRTGIGDWERSRDRLAHLESTAEAAGDPRRLEDSIGDQAAIALITGDLTKGAQLSERLVEMARRRRAPHSLAFGYEGLALCALRVGDFEAAFDALGEIHKLLDGSDDLGSCPEHHVEEDLNGRDLSESLAPCPPQFIIDEALWIELHGMLAVAYLRSGRHDRAEQLADFTLETIGGQAPSNFSAITGYFAPVEVYLALRAGDKSARSRTKRALRVSKRYARSFPIGKPRYSLMRAQYLAAQGKQRRARKHFDRASSDAERMGLDFDHCLCLLRSATAREEGDEMRESELARAESGFVAMGATHFEGEVARVRDE